MKIKPKTEKEAENKPIKSNKEYIPKTPTWHKIISSHLQNSYSFQRGYSVQKKLDTGKNTEAQ
jgi:hypothetical protein